MLFQAEYEGIMVQDRGHSYNTVSCEVRNFFNPFPECVFAYMVSFKDSRGDVPFYLFQGLGGVDKLRGYEEKRFIGKSGLLFQHDIRFPIWRGLAGAVFIATGRVADDTDSLFSGRYHAAYGGGPRYFINKKDNLVIRLDYALGNDSKGIYFTFGEAF
jgi:outer membrane translocation and assembly module TamA